MPLWAPTLLGANPPPPSPQGDIQLFNTRSTHAQ